MPFPSYFLLLRISSFKAVCNQFLYSASLRSVLCVMIAAAIYLNLCTSSCHAIAKRSWSKSHKPNVVYSFHLSAPIFLPLTPRLSNFFFASAFQSKVFSSLSRSKTTTRNIYFIEVNLNCVISLSRVREMEKDEEIFSNQFPPTNSFQLRFVLEEK